MTGGSDRSKVQEQVYAVPEALPTVVPIRMLIGPSLCRPSAKHVRRGDRVERTLGGAADLYQGEKPRKVRAGCFSKTASPNSSWGQDLQAKWMLLTGKAWPYDDTAKFPKITAQPESHWDEAQRQSWMELTWRPWPFAAESSRKHD